MARTVKKPGTAADSQRPLTLHGNHAGRRAEALRGREQRRDAKPGFLRKSNAPGRRP